MAEKKEIKPLPGPLETALRIQAGLQPMPPAGAEVGTVGFDGYNGDLTGEVSATLGTNCGMSTGRNGVISPAAFAANQRDEVRDLHDVAGALGSQPGMKQQTFIAKSPIHAAGVISKGNGDCFLTEETHTSLTGGGGQAGQGYPCVMVAAFSAGAGSSAGSIGYSQAVAPTLKGTQSGNCMPSVLCLNDQGGSVMDCSEDVVGTLRAQEHGHQPLVLFENHGIDSRYRGPLHVAPTMSARYGTGGNNVPLVGNPKVGAATPPSLYSRQRVDVFKENEVTCTQSARQHKDATDLVLEGPFLIRRLTPLECERLQGYPDRFTEIPGASDASRYAQWIEDKEEPEQPKTITLSYDGNGDGVSGLPGNQSQDVKEDALAEFTVSSVRPTRSGYIFTGWNTHRDGNGIDHPAGDTLTAISDVILYAQWKRENTGGGGSGGSGGGTTYYTLRYESNGGTQYKDERYARNTVVDLKKVPSRDGYTFIGWFADESLSGKITEVKMTSDKTVYAGWRQATVPGMLNGDDHFAYVIGYTDGTVRPLNNISRAEVATIFFRLLQDEIRDGNLTDVNTFADVTAEMWCNKPISTMAALGIVKGRSAELFDPDAPITRAEFATICARFDTSVDHGASNFTDIAGHWAEADIERAATLGWIKGYTDGTFRPEQYITRAEAMTMINRVLCRIPEKESDLLDGMIVWPDNNPGDWHYVRRLKRIGVGVYFEKENVNTLFMDNEMILTFFFSQAQAESESLSGNVKWGHRKNFKDGKVYYNYQNFLGYRKGADGQPEVDEAEAAVVRRIFSRYLIGHSIRKICHDLMADGIKTSRGKTVWHDSVIQNMLQNEKYIGDALLQKTYIADLFTHQSKKNDGILPKYYVHECHPPIIDRETFQKVQEEIARRSSLRKTSSKAKTELARYSGKYALNEILVCGECGSPYRRKLWIQNGERRYVWRCLNRLEHGRKLCRHSPTLDETELHWAITSAMNEMFQMHTAKQVLEDSITAALAGEEQELTLPAVESRIRGLQERQMELFQLAVSAGADCTEYDEEIQRVNIAKTSLMLKKAELERLSQSATAFQERMTRIGQAVESTDAAITQFDDLTVRQLISNIKVIDKDRLFIRFKDGTEIEQNMAYLKGGCA